MAYTTIDNPELYFQTKLYTGNATDDTAITLDGSENMQPDLIWTKERSQAGNHNLFDSVRGISKRLRTETNAAEGTLDPVNQIKSFDSDGFTLGTNNGSNENSVTFVSWNWKAGTSFSNDASSTSIGDIDSSGSVSQTSGFSICSYAGSGSSGDTIKHGLSTAPKIIIIKKRSASDNWTMLNTNIDLNTHLHLNTTDSAVSDPMFTNTAPTTSVFTVDSDGQVNESGHTFIAYCFSEVKGYSKLGLYKGNGNADGTFVYTGFKPAWVLMKATTAGEHWNLHDNKRDPINVCDAGLKTNESNQEEDADRLDFVSNGFKHRSSSGGYNSSNTFIYMAFAEAPFVNSNGVPVNAR